MLEGIWYIFELHLIKFSVAIDEVVEKNKSLSCKHGIFKIFNELARKRLLEQKYIFCIDLF